MAFQSPPVSDLPMTIAGLAIVVATATTIVLFSCTMLLRASMSLSRRRKQSILGRWRAVFAEAVRSRDAAATGHLPRCAKRDALDLLEEWNRFRATVTGAAADNLVALGRRLDLNVVASRLLHKRKLGVRLLAIRTLGHMGDRCHWEYFLEHLDDANTALSVTCAATLMEVDSDAASSIVMPRILARVDWPRVSVAAILKAAGAQRITMPMCQAIMASDPDTAVRLLGFAEFLRPENVEQVVEAILRERTEPTVIAAALKAVPGMNAVPGVTRLADHGAWYVRMQTARILGRCGEERDLPVLERLLGDREWWVRYRAAQSIVSLPFLGPNGLRSLVARQTDRYAIDMMHHAMAEVGL